MLEQVNLKISNNNIQENLSCRKLSFEDLNEFKDNQFSSVFSNFGGLNCIDNSSLNRVINDTSKILKQGGILNLVIMPKITFYEWIRIFKGDKSAFRRLKKGGVLANVKGENVRTYYHSARAVKKILKSDYKNIQIENIFTIGPSGSSYKFPEKHPLSFKIMTSFTWVIKIKTINRNITSKIHHCINSRKSNCTKMSVIS